MYCTVLFTCHSGKTLGRESGSLVWLPNGNRRVFSGGTRLFCVPVVVEATWIYTHVEVYRTIQQKKSTLLDLSKKNWWDAELSKRFLALSALIRKEERLKIHKLEPGFSISLALIFWPRNSLLVGVGGFCVL